VLRARAELQAALAERNLVRDEVRAALDPWLGEPRWKHSEGRVTLGYRFDSEDVPPVRMKLKVEINSREHFTALGHRQERFEVTTRWFSGCASIATYELDELLGTKLRALYQRKKGRDLFDLSLALTHPTVDPDRVVTCFTRFGQRRARSPSSPFAPRMPTSPHRLC
jgi:predicted nucleotidyltransferase component of viral defense system